MATTRGESVFKPKNRPFELFLALDFLPSQCEGFARDARFRFTYLYVFQGLSAFFANPTQNALNVWKSVWLGV